MNARTGLIMAGIGLLILLLSFYFFDAANHVVTPQDVIWGLGRFFRDIDRSDIKFLENVGLVGMVIGGVFMVGGLILMYKYRK